MKRSNIKCIGLLVLSALAMGAMGGCSGTGSRVDSAIVRDVTSKVEQEGMFSSIFKTDDNGVFSVKATKYFAGKDLAGYETVADETEEEYQKVYDLSASGEDGAVTLNIRFDDSGEEIIDPFIGEPVMMSESVEAARQNEECGRFSNLTGRIKKAVEDKAETSAHRTLNAAMAAEGIRHHRSFTYRDFESRMDDGKNYSVIMSAWTGIQCDTNTPLHTFLVDKDTGRSNRFKAYDRNCYDTSHYGTDRNSPKDLCYSSDPSDTFVVAHFIEK